MTAAEHATAAERYLAGVAQGDHGDGSPNTRADEPETIAVAHVHATLAVARQLADIAALLGGIRDEIKAAAR